MKQIYDEVYKKAIRLIEGGHEEIEGLIVRAVKPQDVRPAGFHGFACFECQMDCLCKGRIADVCNRIYYITNTEYYLELVNP